MSSEARLRRLWADPHDGFPIGKKFNQLKITGYAGLTSSKNRLFVVLCDCGKKCAARDSDLKLGHKKSCGCLLQKVTAARSTKHGSAKRGGRTPEYKTWAGIIKRCCDEKSTRYSLYGGRGITICDEWRHDFTAFLAHVGTKPSSDYSLDRIDNDGNYEPGNVRWVTQRDQVRNTNRNVNLTLYGVTMCVADWAEGLGIKADILYKRIGRRGWPTDRALLTPVKRVTPESR